jgi:hypothetical protein
MTRCTPTNILIRTYVNKGGACVISTQKLGLEITGSIVLKYSAHLEIAQWIVCSSRHYSSKANLVLVTVLGPLILRFLFRC